MAKLDQRQFAKKVEQEVGWNAEIGFWYGLYYEKYRRDYITLDEALAELRRMHPYLGV